MGRFVLIYPVEFSSRSSGLIGERILRRIRNILFAVLLDQPTSFFDETLSGEIVNRMAADTESLQKFVSFALPQLTHSILLMIACCVVMVSNIIIIMVYIVTSNIIIVILVS